MTHATQMGVAMPDESAPAVARALSAISTARTTLMLDAPFYGALALRLTPTHAPMIAQGTAATDGHSLFFSAAFINELTPKKLVGLLAHEVMHVAMRHTLRREGRNQRDWNIACDHAINNDLIAEHFELPEDGMCDSRFRGCAAEEVYPHVKRPEKTEAVCGGGGSREKGEGSGEGEPQPAPSNDGEQSQESDSGGGVGGDDERLPAGAVLDSPDPVADEAELTVAVTEAAMCAKAAGNLPAHLRKLINALTSSKVDFKTLLAEYVTRCVQEDYTLTQPNRRYISQGIYLPSMKSDATPEIAFLMDTSGSRYSDAQLQQTVDALNDCVAQVQPERVHAMACDTSVTWRRTFERGEVLEVETPGGGGTYLQPMLDALAADGIEPAVAVIITDGYVGSWPEEPPYPVVWLMSTDIVAPYGVTVRLPEDRGPL